MSYLHNLLPSTCLIIFVFCTKQLRVSTIMSFSPFKLVFFVFSQFLHFFCVFLFFCACFLDLTFSFSVTCEWYLACWIKSMVFGSSLLIQVSSVCVFKTIEVRHHINLLWMAVLTRFIIYEKFEVTWIILYLQSSSNWLKAISCPITAF